MQRPLLLLVLVLVGAVAVERWLGASTGSTPSAAVATASEPIEYLTVTQMVARARRYQAPTVLVLYGTKCPLSQKLMPGLEHDIVYNESRSGTYTFRPSAPGEDNGRITLHDPDGDDEDMDITQVTITDVNTVPGINGGEQEILLVYVKD